MKTTALFAVALVSLAGLAPLARGADATPADKSLVMGKLDPDSDGTVSRDEAAKAAEAKFAALDTDAEGTLDANELTGIMSAKQISMIDGDKDATIDKAEYLKAVATKFKLADKDGDGTLDAAELSSEAGRALVAMLAY